MSFAVQKQGRDLEQEAGYLVLVKIKPLLIRLFTLDQNSSPRGLSPLTWQDNATFEVKYEAQDGEAVTFEIQDQYKVPTILPVSIHAKWKAMQALLDRAKSDASDAWYINFASGASSGAYPNAVAGRMNPPLYVYLGGAPFANRLGTLMMDFPDDNMIGRIIGLNTSAVVTSRQVGHQQAA